LARSAPAQHVPPASPGEGTPGARSAAEGKVAPEITIVARDWRTMQTPAQITRWDALTQWAAQPNPFFESWFLLPALRSFDPDGRVSLLCLEVDGQLAGLVPLTPSARYYGHRLPHWRIWLHDNAFLGLPLVARGFERIAWEQVFAWVDRQGGSRMLLHCPQMPQDGPLAAALSQVLKGQNRHSAVVAREERALLSSPLAPEAYLEQSLSGKKRKELRRQHRRLAEMGALEIERTRSAIGLSGWTQDFLALEQHGWKGRAGSAIACDPATETLFVQALEGAARRNRLERLAIRLDGRPLAMLANFHCGEGVFSFKTAYDEEHARFSPGVLLQRENLELLNQPEFRWADSCAAADHPMIDHFWRERRSLAAINVAIGGPLRRTLFRALAAWETRSTGKGIEA
jgi:CelD/BcsL family acetyltransferase involved in cellulose biosynthesis